MKECKFGMPLPIAFQSIEALGLKVEWRGRDGASTESKPYKLEVMISSGSTSSKGEDLPHGVLRIAGCDSIGLHDWFLPRALRDLAEAYVSIVFIEKRLYNARRNSYPAHASYPNTPTKMPKQ